MSGYTCQGYLHSKVALLKYLYQQCPDQRCHPSIPHIKWKATGLADLGMLETEAAYQLLCFFSDDSRIYMACTFSSGQGSHSLLKLDWCGRLSKLGHFFLSSGTHLFTKSSKRWPFVTWWLWDNDLSNTGSQCSPFFSMPQFSSLWTTVRVERTKEPWKRKKR